MLLFCKASIFILNIYHACLRYAIQRITAFVFVFHTGKDIFQLEKIFFPINLSNQHWVCAVAYMQKKRIQFYDSMGGRGQSYLENIFRYLQDEYRDKKQCVMPNVDEWELVPCTSDTPRQRNCYDCGVFTCMFCDFLAQDCPLVFGQEHVTQCRQRIALSILNGEAIL